MFKLKKILAAAMVMPLLCFVLPGCVDTFDEYEVKHAYVFGGIMPFVFWGHGKNVDKAYREMLDALENIDRLTNVNRSGGSDVLNINLANAEEEIEIDAITYDLIELAKQYYTDTAAAFNVAAYPLLYLWGIDAYGFTDYCYDQNYQKTNEWTVPPSFVKSEIERKLPLPDYDEVLRVKQLCDLDKLRIFKDDGKYFAVKSIDGLMMDLGGIAKGYAADLCAKICQQNDIKSAKIDLSGNLLFIGQYLNQADWNVGISYPAARNSLDESDYYFCAFSAGAGASAVTSGDYQRFRTTQKDGEKIVIPHIINSATGLPYTVDYDPINGYQNIKGSVTSCTVISNESAFADAYATAACVMGIAEAASFFERERVKAIMFTADKKSAFTAGAQPVLTDIYSVYKDFDRITN